MRKTESTRAVAFAAAVLALVLGGCGSSYSKSTSSTGAAASPPASTSTSTAAASGGGGYAGSSGGSSASSEGTSGGSAAVVTVSAKSNKLGKILAAGPKHVTVYLFEADHGGQSACSGACASVWPPVTGSGSAATGAKSAELGTITRPDGTKQVTYNGHPLYYYAKDGDSGDAYGQGSKAFGAEWYVLSPSGNKIDKS